MKVTQRLAAIALLLVAAAAAVVTVDGARPADAEEARLSGRYLVIDVPQQVVDDLLAVQRGTSPWSGDFPQPELELSFKYCGTYQCLCIDVEPEECVPDSDRGADRISLSSSLRTPAVLDRVARELKSGSYSAVRLCSTFQALYVGCVEASLPQK